MLTHKIKHPEVEQERMSPTYQMTVDFKKYSGWEKSRKHSTTSYGGDLTAATISQIQKSKNQKLLIEIPLKQEPDDIDNDPIAESIETLTFSTEKEDLFFQNIRKSLCNKSMKKRHQKWWHKML